MGATAIGGPAASEAREDGLFGVRAMRRGAALAALSLVGLLAASPSIARERPLKLIVSLQDQTLDVFSGDEFVERVKVSTGMRGFDTPSGIFSVLEKRRWHRSNIYSGAPMPFMQRLTWSGVALHAGRLPGYPASHGCIRLPDKVAASLFERVTPGSHVIVVPTRQTPVEFAHAALPQPLRRDPASQAPKTQDQSSKPVVTEQTADGTPPAANAAQMADKSTPVVDAPTPGVEAPKSRAPLRILLTRREGRERVMDVQRLLRELGHDPGEIDGYIGRQTGAAIGAFQTSVGLPANQTMSAALVARLHEAAGKPVLNGHLYVRQDFRPLFDAPVAIANGDQGLGTYVFSAIDVDESNAKAQWSLLELEKAASQSPGDALGRFVIPETLKVRLAELLTPGSSLVVTDRGLGPNTTPHGSDFIVVTNRSQ